MGQVSVLETSGTTDTEAPAKRYQSNDLVKVQSLDLPQSIYSAGPVLTMMVDDKFECGEMVLGLMPYWALLYFTVACQAAVIYYVNDIVGDQTDGDMNVDCPQAPHILQLVALGCFTTLVVADLDESFTMARYFMAPPRVSEWVGIDYFTIDSQENIDGFEKGQGVTTAFVWAMGVMVIAPKIAVACGIWWTGTAFLLAAPSSEELLLNAVALVFVLDIDDYIYKG